MGTPAPMPEAKLVCGLLAADEALLERGIAALEPRLGPVQVRSEAWPFTATDYYADEMGAHLIRRFVAFGGLFVPEHLPRIKRIANEIELSICQELGRPGDRRPVNLDPGYLTLGKLVLATTKDHAHRIYVGDGIYAEVTLRYQQHRWQAWPWTYPDYASAAYHPFLLTVRQLLKNEVLAHARSDQAPRGGGRSAISHG